MTQIINLYLIAIGLITVLNRGGAGLGFGILNISLLVILVSPFLYLIITKGNQLDSDFTIIIFIFICLVVTLNQLNITGINSSSVRAIGVLIYPFSTLGGICLSNKKNFIRTLKSLRLIFSLSIIYGILLPWVKSYFLNKIIINNVSLFGIYGSYYTVTNAAFCFFFSGYGGEKNTKRFSLPAAVAVLVTGTRGGILGLIIAFFINLYNKSRNLISKKSLFSGIISIIFILLIIVFIFPFFKTEGLRNTFDLDYFWNAFLSIFSDSEDKFGTAFIGSRTHRILMFNRTIDLIFSNLNYFFSGIPFVINYTDTEFNDPHNGLLSLLARGGIFTALSFLFLQYQIIRRSLKIREILGPNPFSSFSLSFIFSSLAMLLFTTMLTSPMNAIPYYFTLGIIWQINKNYIKI